MPTPSSDYLSKLITHGACAVHVLKKRDVAPLLIEASRLAFRQRESPTQTGVVQNFSGFDTFEPDSPFMDIARVTELMLNRFFDRMICTPIKFNDYSLQYYPVSKPGDAYAISPHKDHKNCINLIAVYILKGRAQFCVCPDRSGVNAIEVHSHSNPGDLILMRGTGFRNSDFRPFHFVGKVTEERLTFGLRQTIDMKELPKYHKQ